MQSIAHLIYGVCDPSASTLVLLGGVEQWVVHLLGSVAQWVVHLLGGVAQWVARLIHKWSVLNSSQIKNLLFPCARNFTLIA